MTAPRPHFPPEALRFLRALSRNNERDWFRQRRESYDSVVRGPMVAVIEQLDRDFRAFAPDLVASPKLSLYRIYRDTRFSEDKSPLKTHIGAFFPHRALPKNESPGLYLEVNTRTVLAAGGLYMPTSPQLHAIRSHLLGNVGRFRSLVEAPAFRRVTGGLQGDQLLRVPRGFPPDDPAADYLRYRQFLVWREWPASLATSPRFYATVLGLFRTAAPLVGFLCEPLLGRPSAPARPPRFPETRHDLRRRS